MALLKINHYSITAPASVYDEEALTAIELSARTAKKVNDCVDAFNNLESTIDKTIDDSVNDYIEKGGFDAQIKQHTDAVVREVSNLNNEVKELDKRVDNIVVSGSENSPEVIDIRSGADGVTYPSAGSSVRGQLNKKVDLEEYYPVNYELGGLSITEAGWDYTEEYGRYNRVRIKEGHELHLKAGDVIGLRDYSDARFFVGIRVAGEYSFAGWLTQDYVVETDGDYVILVAHTVDKNLTQPEDVSILGSLIFVKKLNGAANIAKHTPDNIKSTFDIDLGFTLGAMNTEGLYNSFARYVTRDILCLDIDIVVKRSDVCRVAVYTFTDSTGRGVSDKGWVTDNGDYIIKAGTFFRLMVMAKDYSAENQTFITASEQYNHEIYKAITVEPLHGRGINLMNSAKTLIRINAYNTTPYTLKEPTPRKVKAINHRGYNYKATENTLTAFKHSKANGFDYVECDVRFSSDGHAVLFHDDTVDRISDGTGRVCDKTLIELLTLDLGGDGVATFVHFIQLCARLQLHPYIEIEPNGDSPINMEQAEYLVDIVKRNGMLRNVTWISFRSEDLLKVLQLDRGARVGYIVGAQVTNVEDVFKTYTTLMTGVNEVFIDLQYNSPILDECVSMCAQFGASLEVWTVNDDNPDAVEIVKDHPYISGVTSDNADIGQLIVDKVLEEFKPSGDDTDRGTFTYNGKEYPFDIGATWEEYCDSDDNEYGFEIDLDANVVRGNDGYCLYDELEEVEPTPHTKIKNGGVYC